VRTTVFWRQNSTFRKRFFWKLGCVPVLRILIRITIPLLILSSCCNFTTKFYFTTKPIHSSGINTLRSSALALCYSAAEYCAPVWSRSAHTSRVDVQLNSTMRLISGTLRSTPLPWLPVLSNIEPPALRRKAATDKLVEKIVKHASWPIQSDILSPPSLRLTSRKPLWLDLQPVDIKSRWRHNWKSAHVVNSHLVCDPTIRQPGFDLPRQQWSLLNRFRTKQVHCGACRRKWRLTDTDLCLCGETQTMSHIVEFCPLTKLNGGYTLRMKSEDAVLWLTNYG